MTVAAHPLQLINIRAACFVIGATIAKASRPAMRLGQATRRRWRFVVSACKLLPGKLQNLSSTSCVSACALTIVRLKQEIKRDVILSHGLVCVIDGVLVVTTQLPSRNRAG